KARSKNLAVRQYSLLVSALQVVKHGGRIVYSTCSLSPLENDDVIARLLKKRKGEATVVKPTFEIGEPTELGWQILPDKTGFGPIYLSVLERI
ncbi:MAG: RsmB/NOP family class I SAM-dependent RNA methyltransferase, partial [Bdellovibrionota bacterium]